MLVSVGSDTKYPCKMSCDNAVLLGYVGRTGNQQFFLSFFELEVIHGDPVFTNAFKEPTVIDVSIYARVRCVV